MKEGKLPIKFFSKREEDGQQVEGGGSNKPPRWILSNEELYTQQKVLLSQLDGIFDKIKWDERDNIPVVLKAEMNKDAIAKTHRRRLKDLFATVTDNVIGMFNEKTLMVKVPSIQDETTIRKNIFDSEKYAYAISGIDNIKLFHPIIRSDNKTVNNYKVKLINFQDYALNNGYRKYFEQKLVQKKIDYKATQYSPTMTIYKILEITKAKLDSLNDDNIFDLAFEVVPMPKVGIKLDMLSTEKQVLVKHPNNDDKNIVVGVLDNGIEKIAELDPWIEGNRISPYPDSFIDATHGTFVAGVIVYGDELQETNLVGAKNIKVFDAAIYPNRRSEGLEEDELIENIREIIKSKYAEIKIWNLSISIDREITEEKFSDFAIALDSIQDEYNVLICKSAGNCPNFKSGLPIGRINEGADSVRSLVVGSLADKKQGVDIAEVNNPSPFSRVGPGPSYIIKPEIVHFGGNAGINFKNEIVESGVYSFSKDGTITEHAGTSFSTPRVSALAAGLYKEIDEEFDPLLLKALIVHSASYPNGFNIPNNERTKYSGFGVPKTVSQILYNAPNEVSLILKDSIAKKHFIDIKDFPMPECLIKDGYYTGQVIVTLVYDPVLDDSQGAEYCQSNIDVRFGSYDEKKRRDTTKNNILNPIGRKGTQNILLNSLYSKRKVKDSSTNFAKTERMLIHYGDKYYPVKKYAVDLSELTDGNKSKYATSDKKWYLTLEGVYRNHVEEKAMLDRSVLSQKFCLIITLRHTDEEVKVYDGVTQKLDEYNFLHSNIRLAEKVSVHI